MKKTPRGSYRPKKARKWKKLGVRNNVPVINQIAASLKRITGMVKRSPWRRKNNWKNAFKGF